MIFAKIIYCDNTSTTARLQSHHVKIKPVPVKNKQIVLFCVVCFVEFNSKIQCPVFVSHEHMFFVWFFFQRNLLPKLFYAYNQPSRNIVASRHWRQEYPSG